MNTDRERFLAAGFDHYVEKPLDIRELRREVATALERA
jgi:DNA-binding response OmpR family regulator